MTQILIIDDERSILEYLQRQAADMGLDALVAQSINEGRELFDQHKRELQLILLDGRFHHVSTDRTIGLIRHMRSAGYQGELWAITGDYRLAGQMIRAGCTIRTGKELERDLLEQLAPQIFTRKTAATT